MFCPIFMLVGGGNKGRRDVVLMVRKSSLFILNWKDSLSINVAYNDNYGFFEIANNSMVEWHDFWMLLNGDSMLLYDFEILEIFFEDKIINWINCNQTWGWYDDETERWTGAVGKVKLNTFLLNYNSLI